MNLRERAHYCACTASPERRDPDLAFRFTLLRHLIGLQVASNDFTRTGRPAMKSFLEHRMG